MKHALILASLITLPFVALQAHGQASVTFNFSDGAADGWANSGFSGTPAATVTPIGGVNYMFLPVGGFQVGNFSSGDTSSAFFQAMLAAAANPTGYDLSYNWSVDTSTWGANSGTFLQMGTFVNTGSGYYAQNYGASQVQLSGAQVASGQVFSGTVTISFAAAGFTMPTDTFYRLGFIVNSDGSAPVGGYFTDISITPVPEPSSLALLGLAAPAWWIMRIRRSVRS